MSEHGLTEFFSGLEGRRGSICKVSGYARVVEEAKLQVSWWEGYVRPQVARMTGLACKVLIYNYRINASVSHLWLSYAKVK